MKRILIWTGLSVAAGAGVWLLAGRDSGTAEANAFERIAVAGRKDLVVSITASGTIQPIERVEVKSKASGEIVELPVDEGDRVRRGDLIARLNPTTARNDHDQAVADHAVAEITRSQREREKDRLESIFAQKLASQSELDDARLAFEQANAALVRARSVLSTAKERLEDTEVRAPIDGVVLDRPVEMGQVISSGTTTVTGGTLLCTVANMSMVHVVADVDETDIGKVREGMRAAVSPDAFDGRVLTGDVIRIAPKAKMEQTVTVFEVTVLVDNAEGLLKSGMNATVEVETARADGVVSAPVKAVELAAARRHGTVTLLRGGERSRVEVVTGLANLDEIEIREGVAEGDTLVYSLVSGAMADRERARERMREMGSVPGMRKTN